MGTSFANLQVFKLPPAEGEKLVTDATAKSFVEEWTTILRDDFQIGVIEREAQKLSKKIDQMILSVGYFDDDILTLGLYQKGKRLASHISNTACGLKRKLGNINLFLLGLGLQEQDSTFLKLIFQCEDTPLQLDLLMKLSDLPLSADFDYYEDYPLDAPKYVDKASIEEYVKEKSSEGSIKNSYKVKLLFEFEGMIDLPIRSDYFLINYSNEGKYGSRVFTICKDGSLNLFQKDSSLNFSIGAYTLASKDLVCVFEPGATYTDSSYATEPTISFFTKDGDVLQYKEIIKGSGQPDLLLDDGMLIYSEFKHNKQMYVVYAADSGGNRKWELETGYLHVHPTLNNGSIYFHYKDKLSNQAEIIKVAPDGTIEARCNWMPSGARHWWSFLFDNKGNMYYCCVSSDIDKPVLRCFNKNLEVILESELQDTSFSGLLDQINERLFLEAYKKELLSVDTKSFNVLSHKKLYAPIYLDNIDSQGNILTHTNTSSIEVLNNQLKVVSRNKLKGEICSSYKNAAGNICYLTCNGQAWNSGKVKSLVRVYEVLHIHS